MIKNTIRTVADAVRFFRHLQIDVIETDGGWILHWLAPSESDYELCCDTAEELIEYARAHRDSGDYPLADHRVQGFAASAEHWKSYSPQPNQAFRKAVREELDLSGGVNKGKEVRA